VKGFTSTGTAMSAGSPAGPAGADGIAIVNWYGMMGIGQVVTLRLPASRGQPRHREWRLQAIGFASQLERDDFSSISHHALSFCLSMISAQTRSAFVARENRYALFRIML